MRSGLSLIAAVFIALAGFAPKPTQAAPQSFGDRVVFTAVTYDNGTGGDLKGITDLFYDSYTDELYACVPSDHSIVIYDDNLTPRYAFRHYVADRRTAGRILGEPNSIAVTRDGDILVLDGLANYIDLLDFRGEPVEQLWLNRIYGDTNLTIRPLAIAKDEADNFYITTGGDLATIIVLNPDLTYKRRIGHRAIDSSDVEGFMTVVGLHVSKGLVFVSDLYAVPALKIYDTSGHYISGFGGHTVEKNDITMGTGIAIMTDSVGDPIIFSCDELRQVIKVFTKSGQFLANIGGFGNGVGAVAYPTDIVASRNNTFFISEKVGKRIQRFEVR